VLALVVLRVHGAVALWGVRVSGGLAVSWGNSQAGSVTDELTEWSRLSDNSGNIGGRGCGTRDPRTTSDCSQNERILLNFCDGRREWDL